MRHREAFPPSCRDFATSLPWLANGSLARQEARELREHLIRCAACRKELRETRAMLTMIGSAAEAQRTAAVPPEVSAATWSHGLRWAAAVLVLLGATLVLGSLTGRLEAPLPTPPVASSASAATLEAGMLSRMDFEKPDSTAQSSLFADGFETRDLTGWSSPRGTIVHN